MPNKMDKRKNIRFHNVDCNEFMSDKPDNYYDLAIVDPEYGIGAGKMTMGSGKHKFKKGKNWDKSIPNNLYFDKLFNASLNQIIWGGNYFSEHLKPTPHWIVWDKLNPNLSFAEGELAWMSSGKNLRIFKHYSAKVEENGKIHPTQKPVALYKWLLLNYAKPNDKILDTHGGSMSIAIAVDSVNRHEKMNLSLDICELDSEYYKAALKRFDEQTRQRNIFD